MKRAIIEVETQKKIRALTLYRILVVHIMYLTQTMGHYYTGGGERFKIK